MISCICYWTVARPVILKPVLVVKAVILNGYVTGVAIMNFIVALC
jgi:hypothetical protein